MPLRLQETPEPAADAPPPPDARGHRSLASMFRRRLIGAGLATIVVAGLIQYFGVQQLRRESQASRLSAVAQLTAEQVSQFVLAHRAAVSLVAGRRDCRSAAPTPVVFSGTSIFGAETTTSLRPVSCPGAARGRTARMAGRSL